MPPVPSQRPSPGQVPPDLCGVVVDDAVGDVLSAFVFGDAAALGLALAGAAPEAAGVAFEDVDAAFAVGEVRPRFVGRFICRVFWYSPG